MFHSARIKLTLWYLLILVIISAAFSLTLYRLLIKEFDRFSRMQKLRFEHRLDIEVLPQPNRIQINRNYPPPDEELIKETKERLSLFLIIINIFILTVAGGLSYFLAGKTLQPIKKMVDEQSYFITDASHQLRTPITALKSSLEVSLRDKNLTLPEAKKIIMDNLIDTNQLQSLSDSLLQLSQYQPSNTTIQLEKVDLNSTINEAINKIKQISREKNITISYSGKKTYIQGNRFGLVDLFIILLDNAIKYSPIKSLIKIDFKGADKALTVLIKDHGVGIAERDLPRVFERFYRSENVRLQKQTKGFGLGLAIAKRIVDVHKGKIIIESQKNQGTTVSVTFHKINR